MLDKDYLIKGNMYQYNLGWLIDTILSFKSDLDTAIDLKTIKYADPIEWDITTQYAANMVVVDPKSGTAYMSKTAVPSGILLDNTTYWVVVFNYQEIYNKIMDGVAFNDRKNDYASRDLAINDLVWYAGELYRVTKDIANGSKYIVDTNISKISIGSLLKNYLGNDRTASVTSDKLTASGDITEEASNKSVTVSGDYTLNAGDIAETSNNCTIKVTKDREIDINESDNIHIGGTSTLNVEGSRIENYASNKDEKVAGELTETSKNKKTIANNIIFETPTRTVSIDDLQRSIVHTINDFGAIGDGKTDDSEAFQKAYDAGGVVDVAPGTYYCTKAITIKDSKKVIFRFLGDVIFNNVPAIELPPLNGQYGETIYTSAKDSTTPYYKCSYGIYTPVEGTRGNVQSNDVAKASIRANSNNFIWTRLSILSIDEPVVSNSENVASYAQINGRADSDTGMWGACVELNDPHNNPTQPKTGLEITYRSGEADGNKVRHAIHISHLVSDGATGSQVDSAIFVSGAGNDEAYPMANFNTLTRIQSCNFGSLLEGNRTPNDLPPKIDYGFDFQNIITKYAVMRCMNYPIQFNTLFLQEVNGNLNLSGGAHLFSLYPTVSPYGEQQTETYTYLPLDIDGKRYLIPLFTPNV